MTQLRKAKHVLVGLYLLFSVGCGAQLGTAMPRVASGIEATKDLWRAACLPVPVVAEKVCADAKDGVNTVVDFYTEVNDAL